MQLSANDVVGGTSPQEKDMSAEPAEYPVR